MRAATRRAIGWEGFLGYQTLMEWAAGLLFVAGAGAAAVATVRWVRPLEYLAAPQPSEASVVLEDATPAVPEVAQNVLVIVVDDLGVDQLRIYRATDAPFTSAIDELARRGMTFQSAFVSTATHASLLTGRTAPDFADDEVTIPEMLATGRHTYTSSAVGRWRLSGLHTQTPSTHPLRQGFDWFAGTIGGTSNPIGDGPAGHFLWVKTPGNDIAIAELYGAASTASDAVDRLAEMSEPWLLWVGFDAPPAIGETGPLSLVTALDAEIGRVLAAIGNERAERTTVVFIGATTADAGGQVPLIVSGPRVRVPGASTDAEVHGVDLFPTVAELAGIDLGAEIDGHSFAGVLADSGVREPEPDAIPEVEAEAEVEAEVEAEAEVEPAAEPEEDAEAEPEGEVEVEPEAEPKEAEPDSPTPEPGAATPSEDDPEPAPEPDPS